jgi:hypothetical protein
MKKYLSEMVLVCFFATVFFTADTAHARSCASFNPSTNIWHIPGVNLYGTSFWADMVITDPGNLILEVIAHGDKGGPGDIADYAFFDSSTSTFTLPCVNVDNMTCWLDMTLIGENPFRLKVKGYGCVPSACKSVTDLTQKLQTTIVSTGDVTGVAGDVTLKNLTGETLYAWLRPGISMKNNSSAVRQDMTVMRSSCVEVPPFRTVYTSVEGACINFDKDAPDTGDILKPVDETYRELVALTQAIDRWLSYGLLNDSNVVFIAQWSIWAITDGSLVSEFAEFLPVEQMKGLFLAAGLDPNDYSIFR